MPFAQAHFPFEQENGISNFKFSPSRKATEGRSQISNPPALYPADYISEAIDQTRGWFYTLLAVATVLGWDAPYKNVIVLGHLLDAKGQKMSKSKGNVVKPLELIARYGADVVRWYMTAVNQAWDPKLFNEADLKTMSNKPFGTLRNLLSFWELHGGNASAEWPHVSLRGATKGSDVAISSTSSPGTLLDSWLRARARQTYDAVTNRLDAYELTDAARAIGEFVDDLSTWWLRRSRERLKEEDAGARSAFSAAIQTTAILLAPFAPFTAEHAWQTLHGFSPSSEGGRPVPAGASGEGEARDAVPRSVHLASWDTHQPPVNDSDAALLQQMVEVRRLCSLGLEARAKANVPVRQPLNAVHLYTSTPLHLNDALLAIVREELNVKAVVEEVAEGALRVELDTTLTPELKREGMVRELTRAVNNLRKEMGLTPSDRIRVTYQTDDTDLAAAIEEHRSAIERATQSNNFSQRPAPTVASGEGEGGAAHELHIGTATLTLDIARA
ncbi:class I tRNA ligase family protein [Candidatus Uhrbacteria bacterium]|nr:class I tRNA ligase family protein [Candidatus Uhrbacteria bacterium]